MLVGFLAVLATVSGMIFKFIRETGIRSGFPIDPKNLKK
jgi:hypothetical protein